MATDVKGTAWLAEHVNDVTGKDYDGYQIRIVLRKLAKDGVIEREEGRYNFTGPNDPQVKAVVKAIKSGAADKARTEKLDELKAKRTAKKTAAPVEDEDEAPAPRSRARKAAAAKKAAPASRSRRKAQPVDDDEDLDIDEI